METETFYLIDVPGGDRRYIERNLSRERYKRLKEQKEGTRIFKVVVPIPSSLNHDARITTAPAEEF